MVGSKGWIMSIRKRGKKWEVTVYVTRSDGRRLRLYKSFDKKSDASKWEREQSLLYKGQELDITKGDILLPRCVEIYLDELKNTSRSSTFDNYKSDLSSKLAVFFEYHPMNKITHKLVGEYLMYLRSLGISNRTVNRCIASTKAFFKWASEGDTPIILRNPTTTLKNLDITDNSELKYWDKDELNLFLELVEDHPYRDVFVFILNTGLRISEALGLTVDKFYALNGVIDVHRQLGKYIAKDRMNEPEIDKAVVFGPLKSSLPRKLAMNDVACEIIARNCKGKKPDDFIFEPIRKRIGDKRKVVFKRGPKPATKEKFCLIANNFYKDVFIKIIEKHNLKSIGLHGLRHTFASQFMMNGGDLYELSKILGHKDIKNTQIYAHFSPKYLARSKNVVVIGGGFQRDTVAGKRPAEKNGKIVK